MNIPLACPLVAVVAVYEGVVNIVRHRFPCAPDYPRL
jgi:hypothetical protein